MQADVGVGESAGCSGSTGQASLASGTCRLGPGPTIQFNGNEFDGNGWGARGIHRLTTIMLRRASAATRSTVRLLATPRSSLESTRSNALFLHKHLIFDSPLILPNQISAASTLASTPRLQTRPFVSTSRNPVRHPRSGDHQRAIVNRPLVGTTDDDSPRKGRKANPFLPFRASSFVDAFVTTIVGVGISELHKHERVVELDLRYRSFRCRNRVSGMVQMEGSRKGMLPAWF